MGGWVPWVWIGGFLAVYAAGWFLGDCFDKRANRKHGRLRAPAASDTEGETP